MNFDLLLTFKLTLLWLYFGKSCKATPSRKLQKSLKHVNIHINRAAHYEITPFQKYEKFVFFGGFFFKSKNCWHLEFLMNQIFGQSFIIFKKVSYRVNYCWNYGPSKLLFHFIEYRLNQLNRQHTKIAVNSVILYFEGCCQKNCRLKVWSFLVHPPQNSSPVKFLRNWTEIIF